ncbi:MAG TPA: bacteriohemerythrin [Stenomitos sp.]
MTTQAFAWKPSLNVGFAEIDQQHQELFKAANNLVEAMGSGKGREEVEKVLNFLQDYVVNHFQTEERYMKRYDYPSYTAHKAMHDKFVQDFLAWKAKYQAEGASTRLAIALQDWCGGWLVNHISKTDQELGKFLQARHA